MAWFRLDGYVTYLEDVEVGKWYRCRLYDGEDVVVKYVGDDVFEDCEFYYNLYDDVRYVLEEIDAEIAGRLDLELLKDCFDLL